MSGFLIIVIVILAYAFYRGYNKGFVYQLAALLSWVLAYQLSSRLAGWVHQLLLSHNLVSPDTSKYISYILCFIGIIFLVKLLAFSIVKFLKMLGINLINKFAGGVLSVILFFLVVSIFTYFLIDLHILDYSITTPQKGLEILYETGKLLMESFF